jgi:Mg-chelatase subunit ChlD
MPIVNHEVKGTLAKLLATENLIIEHKKVPTACFDVHRRVLTLPIWDRASSTVYDLLVGHEVGHALYTPNEDWREIADVPKDYVNVVEDARIEKLMKRKFPGLARTFYNGYSELNRDDFFGIVDEDLNHLTLIDRINLHFKIGAYAQMPFNEFEQQFVEMIEGAETFQQVLTICELIHKYVKEKQQEELSLSIQSSAGQQGGGDSTGQSDQQITSDGQGMTNPGGDDQQEQTSSGSAEAPDSPIGSGGGGPNEELNEDVSKTQQAFDQQAEKLTNHYASETTYIERPQLKMDEVIADYKILNDYINAHFSEVANVSQYSENAFKEVDADYKKYRTEAQKEVNYLVKEFEMKKSADAYQRMSTARTGTLDTSKLHTYKYNEDLFRKVSVIPDGKNHGLVFVLDWSGSMNDYLLDTVKQLLNLVWFCKKVQIPFEVYAFTYEWSNSYIDSNYSAPKSLYRKQDGTIEVHRRFRLLNFLSSRANNKVLDNCIQNLWRLAAREDSNYNGATYHHYGVPAGLDLSGTPLNESIIALHQIIPQFKTHNKLQKVNVVILTDGEANHLNFDLNIQRPNGSYNYIGQNYISGSNALRDRKIGYVYRNFEMDNVNSNLTAILLENLKDNFPEVNLIGFRICSGNNFSYLYRCLYKSNGGGVEPDEAMKVWRKDKSYEINGMGYDALYMISSHDLAVDTTMTVEEEATAADIGRAFRTMLKKKTTNKKLLSSFATLVS